MAERRTLKRRHLVYYLRVFDHTTGKLLGHVVNLSPEGVMLISETPIEPQAAFSLVMHLPAEVAGTTELRFTAQLRWTGKDINPDFYASGFSLTGLSEDHIEQIRFLIDEFGFYD